LEQERFSSWNDVRHEEMDDNFVGKRGNSIPPTTSFNPELFRALTGRLPHFIPKGLNNDRTTGMVTLSEEEKEDPSVVDASDRNEGSIVGVPTAGEGYSTLETATKETSKIYEKGMDVKGPLVLSWINEFKGINGK
jgi:hypothetical protein